MSTQKRKLTRSERKQIEAAIARAKGTDKKKLSAQDSIPYERMWPDGICRVTDKFYTKTVQFQDIFGIESGQYAGRSDTADKR